jgi:hypothetical protein
MSTLLNAAKTLDREFLGMRAKLIDIAASLDRIDRADGSIADDPRIDKISKAAEILKGDSPNRAEQIQMLFSLPN